MTFNLDQIINKITEKTNSQELIWIQYDLLNDCNPYSKKYFSTINELQTDNGYISHFRNGYLFLIPGYDGQYYLFLQPTPSDLPVALNYGATYYSYSSRLEMLYKQIKASFNPLDTFLHQLLD